ncbi:hypothetical protein SNEBB_004979 [Seison nebaliae]|nr:hypothetical protein SNEBB_004979 [Seison nebaliae]
MTVGPCLRLGHKIYTTRCGRGIHNCILRNVEKSRECPVYHSFVLPLLTEEICVQPVPVLADNLAYIVWKPSSNQCLLIDCGASTNVIEQIENLNLIPFAILSTHKHFDHTFGNKKLKKMYPNMRVYGSITDKPLKHTHLIEEDGQVLKLIGFEIICIQTGPHTRGHLCYYFPSTTPVVFVGDFLFYGTYGCLFEGSTETFKASLNKFLQIINVDTLMYFGHSAVEQALTRDSYRYLMNIHSTTIEQLAWKYLTILMYICNYQGGTLTEAGGLNYRTFSVELFLILQGMKDISHEDVIEFLKKILVDLGIERLSLINPYIYNAATYLEHHLKIRFNHPTKPKIYESNNITHHNTCGCKACKKFEVVHKSTEDYLNVPVTLTFEILNNIEIAKAVLLLKCKIPGWEDDKKKMFMTIIRNQIIFLESRARFFTVEPLRFPDDSSSDSGIRQICPAHVNTKIKPKKMGEMEQLRVETELSNITAQNSLLPGKNSPTAYLSAYEKEEDIPYIDDSDHSTSL